MSTTGHSQAVTSPIVRDDGVMDGGALILQIHCPSGKRTTVRLYNEDYQQYKTGMTCIYRDDGSEICRNEWNHDDAAVEACSQ